MLAVAGLLDGYTCTIHWEYLASLREEHPKINISDNLYCTDRNRITASGGIASLDMMLTLVGEEYGRYFAASISDMLLCERIRTQDDQQRIPLNHLFGASKAKLQKAVALMEANIEEPLKLIELTNLVGVSLRQLQRLYKENMSCSPSAYYTKIRLYRARQMLMQSNIPLSEVIVATGFSSISYFSRCYRIQMGHSPVEDRKGSVSPLRNNRENKTRTPKEMSVGKADFHSASRLISGAPLMLEKSAAESTFGSAKELLVTR